MAVDRYQEYLICKRRGHEASGRATTPGTGQTRQICRWCGTHYYYPVPQIVEENVPMDLSNVNGEN